MACSLDSGSRRGVGRVLLGLAVLAVGLLGSGAPGGEARVPARVAGAAAPAADTDAEAKEAGDAEEEEDERFLRGADLHTDYEADSLLRRALELLGGQEPQYHNAALLLQHLIDTAGNALATEDGYVYHPVREKAEQLLARLPEVGLDTYRAEVDGEVRALLGPLARNRDAAALREVADRFFVSSRGDDAAFLLGCLYLDQHQYLRARRAFLRVLRDHPDPSVPKAQVLVRLALACHRSGDAEGARAAWEQLQDQGTNGLAPGVTAAVRREILGALPAVRAPRQEAAPGVRPTREGLFADLPSESLERPRGLWLVRAQHEFNLSPPASVVRVHVAGRFVQGGAKTNALVRNHLAARWEQCGWFPAGAMVFHEGRAFFKSHSGVVCLDAAAGKVVWDTTADAQKQQRTQHISFSTGVFQQNAPTQPYEIALFGDRVGKSLRIVGDTLYHIDEHFQANWARRLVRQVVVINGKRVVREAKQIPQGNRLVALDPQTGKPRWQRGRTLDEKDTLRAVRFLAMPVACGGRLLVPVEMQSELSLVALDPATGKEAWRTFLCAYTASMRAPWYPVGVARRGSEVYVSTGQGVVLALDGIDGSVRWASRYERQFLETTTRNVFYGRGALGWHGNRAFAVGRRVVVLPSDAEQILVFDATSGTIERQIQTVGLRYCLGLAGDSLFVASGDRVRRVALDTGKVLWELKLGGSRRSYGRGFLADGALYVPSGRHILRVSADTGRVDTRLFADLPDGELVGNVFSDGNAFLVYGMGRVYALKSGALERVAVARRLADLERQHAAADPPSAELGDKLAAAYLARARLHLGYGRMEQAAADYRLVLNKLGKSKSAAVARTALFRTLMDLAAEQPKAAPERIREALAVAATDAHKAEALRALAAEHERAGAIEEAARTLLSIARPTKGALLEMDSSGDVWRARPDVLAAAGIRRLTARHGKRVTAVLAEASAAALEAARAKGSFAALQTVLRAYPATPAAVEAGLQAAALEEKRGAIERAELVLREMAASEHRPTAAAGLARLAGLHERQGWLRQAHAEWSRLAARFADATVPTAGGPQAAGTLARKHLADAALAAAAKAPWRGAPKPPWRLVWDYKSEGKIPYISAVSYASSQHPQQADASQFLEKHIFLLRRYKESKVVCKRLRDGATVYERDIGAGRNQYPVCPEANLVAWSGSGGTTVYGLVSGKELWTHKTGSATHRPINIYRSSSMGPAASSKSVLVLRPDGSTVRVIDLATGGVQWERSFRGRAVGWAQDIGRYLILSESRSHELWVCDAFTGEMLTTIELKGRYIRTPYATEHGLLCETYGQGGQRTLALYELPSGKPRWQHDAKQPLRATYVLSDDIACLHLINGDLHIVELATGAVRSKIEGAELKGNVYRPALDATGRYLYLGVYGADRKSRLEVIDLETGKKTRSVAYATGRYVHTTAMSAWARAGDLLPVIVRDPPKKEGNRVRASQLSQVKFIEASTGKVREELKLPVGREDGKVEKLRSIIVQDGVIVLVGYNWIMAFAHDDGTPLKKPDTPG